MGLFNRKKLEQQRQEEEHQKIIEELSKPICQRKNGNHMWRDFPPYLTYKWNGPKNQSVISIIEKYVCVFCHEIKVKTLEEWTYQYYPQKDFFEELESYEKKYKNLLKPRVIVEDMINDAIMVDRQKLQMWDQLHAAEPPIKEKFELQIPKREMK